ncbi:DVUA0089 family protein [Methylomonas paludis]|uniref:DVUA0089 family protein n=1 Tax=Methylomonas paludis TaxID=1173101 RepID=A0A975MQV3_9GAMM|nr:DVUA0089 family protein [Methylomonas paludis]QWF71814.1 DVUA0089 family protein [Methylomonas paludis]
MKKIAFAALLGSCLVLPTSAFCADFDFNGNFGHDNDVREFSFSLGAAANLTLFTSSWVSGRFDPILTLWDSAGNQLFEQDDGGLTGTALSNGTVYQYGEFDNFLVVNLAAGNYVATLTQYDNFSATNQLSAGFLRDSEPFFTSAFGCTNGQFCEGSLVDSQNNPIQLNRSSAWDIHLLNVDSAALIAVPVPEMPISMLLGLAAMAGLSLANTKRFSAKLYTA